ncbi:hypothetical protein [Promicromonospora sp. NPDC050262]|uniref:hypothetical protein n=1 Tax=Promicromonospora sp. NPDC050262 TaxID=3155036 RepID=UPI0033C8A050
MSYFLAPALAQLRDQVNARYPHRDRTSDGWIGDASHAARPSDHNPDWSAGGIVRALDLDEDMVVGLSYAGEALPLARALLSDPRTRYVIYEGAWSYGKHVPDVLHGWKPYTGPNAHRHHIHISVRDVAGYDLDARPWALTDTTTQEDDMTPDESARLKDVEKNVGEIETIVRQLREKATRTEARIVALKTMPVTVDIDAPVLADAFGELLKTLPAATAKAVLDGAAARLKS